MMILYNQIWPLSVLRGSGHSQVIPVHHCTKCQFDMLKLSMRLVDPQDFFHLFPPRTVFIWWFQTIKFGFCQYYKVLDTLRLSWFITVPSVNLMCKNCQWDWLILKFVITLSCKYTDNNTLTTKNGKSINFQH